jgi:hypothetical protein
MELRHQPSGSEGEAIMETVEKLSCKVCLTDVDPEEAIEVDEETAFCLTCAPVCAYCGGPCGRPEDTRKVRSSQCPELGSMMLCHVCAEAGVDLSRPVVWWHITQNDTSVLHMRVRSWAVAREIMIQQMRALAVVAPGFRPQIDRAVATWNSKFPLTFGRVEFEIAGLRGEHVKFTLSAEVEMR